jgi:hypothetical protein
MNICDKFHGKFKDGTKERKAGCTGIEIITQDRILQFPQTEKKLLKRGKGGLSSSMFFKEENMWASLNYSSNI